MRVPLSWLAAYVPLTLEPEELAHRLTMAGIETEFDPGPAGGWSKVVVGHVLAVDPHPNADRLRLATVDTGAGIARVVCGAPNLAPGQRIAFALVGARLTSGKTGEPMELTAAVIRGVESAGMVCSAKELGLGDDHGGILVLPEDAPVGTALADYLGNGALETEVTANRGDCLSVLGIAHEVAAFTGGAVDEPSIAYREGGERVEDAARVTVEDASLCSRYTATVIRGVQVGPSPDWLVKRLEDAGQRSINNVVDVTNYVMLEYGQPLHAFDLAQVGEQHIVVRPARPGESFRALDGEEHELRPPMLVIADPSRAIGLAGVIGGGNSEVTDATTDILLESATFNAINTRRTAQALHIRTEASMRFERGTSPDLAERAVRRATALIVEAAGGTPSRGILDVYPGRAETPAISLSAERMHRVLGTSFPQAQVVGVLRALGFTVEETGPDSLTAVPPYWRTDVAIPEDLVEEVARTIGYDHVPADPLAGRVPERVFQPELAVREEVRDLLVGSGMQEAIFHSLTNRADLDRVGAVDIDGLEPLRIAHPLSREQEYLRTSLRPGLLRAAAAALRQPPGSATLFEVGRVYLPREGSLPQERELAVGVVAGERRDGLWEVGAEPLGFFDAKGVVELVLERLGLAGDFERAEDPVLHPGRTAAIVVKGNRVGTVGEVHPQTAAAFELPVGAALFELDLGLLTGALPEVRFRFAPLSRFPSASRDLALVVDEATPAGALSAALEEHPLVERAVLFDRFSGKGLPAGRCSLAFRLELRSAEGTLSAEAINDAMAALVKRLADRFGAALRA
ncbi:MAG: phenylalanine--tRNA ligase subunit beta [Chloroflexota bacterium]